MTVVPTATRRPAPHLTPEDIEAIGARARRDPRSGVIESRGERDAAYIRRVIAVQRALELGSRRRAARRPQPLGLVARHGGLSLAKILDNMEIGHNVLHGQWDWMRDPKIHSSTWDWDHASPPEQWKRAHNEPHHKYTNIVGQDNDLGYGIMRVDEEPGVAAAAPGPAARGTSSTRASSSRASRCTTSTSARRPAARSADAPGDRRPRLRGTLRKAGKQVAKDYVVHPALSGRASGARSPPTPTANLIRNVWSHSVIMCGHFPEGVETFEHEALDEDETQGEWYVRQMLGSADISGSPLLHLMTGNLSHQIEHHLFPDLPSNRYGEIAPQVEDLFQRYGLSYNARPLVRQVASAWHRVLRLSLPRRLARGDQPPQRRQPAEEARPRRTAQGTPDLPPRRMRGIGIRAFRCRGVTRLLVG